MTTAQRYDNRARLYTLLAVGKRELAMDEDDYRELLRGNGAKEVDHKYSATTMTVPQLERALGAMRRLGFRPRRNNKVERLSDWRKPRIAKLNALWCALADAGVVHNRSEASLTKFCYQFTKVANLQWADSKGLNEAIEALKNWAHREGVKLRGGS